MKKPCVSSASVLKARRRTRVGTLLARVRRTLLWIFVAGLATPGVSHAQSEIVEDDEIIPTHAYLLTGYGSAQFETPAGPAPTQFGASFSPIFLYQINDDFLFESEVEFELEEDVTKTELEYAQIDYSISNNLTLVAGKFLLPFGVFSERYHPTWINRLVSAPPIYGHGEGSGPTDPLVPVLSDVGAQIRGDFSIGDHRHLSATLFVTQGPRAEPGDEDIPELEFGENFTDNNSNKMAGLRAGLFLAPDVEVNFSGVTGKYDDASDLRWSALGAHIETHAFGTVIHGEFIRTWQEFETAAPSQIATLTRNGYWLQVSYPIRKFEPVIRFSQLFDSEANGETEIPEGKQLALGLDYWIHSSLVIKAEYLMNNNSANRFAAQFAFGF